MLNTSSLLAVSAKGIATPTYDRYGEIGVVHLGLGAFHRAHQALAFDALLQRGDARWGVLGVAMRNTALADALAGQHGMYAVQVASNTSVHWQVGGAIWQTCVAAREPSQVVRALAAPATRWVTLTVTEKGYTPELAALLLQGLAARHAAGLQGLTIASCDNLTHNGHQLQALCVDAALASSPVLAQWIATACTFPNSMVDRIVPAASAQRMAAAEQALGVADQAALGTEAFWEWVIERRFVDARDGEILAAVGVTVVDDVAPFEEAKLRMLNGSHSAMACMGAVAGLPVISDCIDHPAVHQFIHGLMTHEVGPQLKRLDWPHYRDALLARFANPSLQHSVHQIATDSSLKIPQRWVPSALDAMRNGQTTERLAFACAAWMRYCLGQDERSKAYVISDPMAQQIQALARQHAGDAAATVAALGSLTAIWGDVLSRHPTWLAQVTRHLKAIQANGILAATAQLSSTPSTMVAT